MPSPVKKSAGGGDTPPIDFQEKAKRGLKPVGDEYPVSPEYKAAQKKIHEVLETINSHFIGRSKEIELMVATRLIGEHTLLESAPGMGKTMAVKLLATTLNADFERVQGTPDTMPSDIRGSEILDPDNPGQFKFIKGPVFGEILMLDEANRAPARTQSALLDAMAEKKVTVQGKAMPLSDIFGVDATQNPIEQEGTYPLPEAQLDRFALKIVFNELTEVESRRLAEMKENREKAPSIEAVLSRDIDGKGTHELLQIRRIIKKEVAVPDLIRDYIVRLAHRIKPHVTDVEVPDYIKEDLADYSNSGERAEDVLRNMAKAYAFIRGGDPVVTHSDVQAVAEAVLAHRLRLKPGVKLPQRGQRAKDEHVRGIVKRFAKDMIFAK